MSQDSRPICFMCEKNPGWVNVFGQWVCGECVAEWDKKTKEHALKDMKAVLNGD